MTQYSVRTLGLNVNKRLPFSPLPSSALVARPASSLLRFVMILAQRNLLYTVSPSEPLCFSFLVCVNCIDLQTTHKSCVKTSDLYKMLNPELSFKIPRGTDLKHQPSLLEKSMKTMYIKKQ